MSTELDVQRRITQAFISADPTARAIALIPRVRERQASGGYKYVDGTPRAPQKFKLSEIAYDQRPTVTIAGVERILDFHLIGPHNAQIAVGDYWMEGATKYEVIGFTDGFEYEIKAQVLRHVPRTEVP